MQGLEGFIVRPSIESPQVRAAAQEALNRMELWYETADLKFYDENSQFLLTTPAIMSRFQLVSILGDFGKEFFNQSNAKIKLTDSPWWALTDARFEYGRRKTDTGIWYANGRRGNEPILVTAEAVHSLNGTVHERLVRSFVGQAPEKMFERFASAFETAAR